MRLLPPANGLFYARIAGAATPIILHPRIRHHKARIA